MSNIIQALDWVVCQATRRQGSAEHLATLLVDVVSVISDDGVMLIDSQLLLEAKDVYVCSCVSNASLVVRKGERFTERVVRQLAIF
jgi:hypothetical protein